MRKRVSSSVGLLVVVVVVVVVAAVLVVVSVWEVSAASGTTNFSQCKEQKNQVINECRLVIYRQDPFPSCCKWVRVIPVKCVWPYVTPYIAALVGVERTIKQIQDCGRVVPHNFECGSVTTP